MIPTKAEYFQIAARAVADVAALDHVPVYTVGMFDAAPWAYVEFGSPWMLQRSPLMLVYMRPTAAWGFEFYTVDDFGNCVRTYPAAMNHYRLQEA